jgi:hypothetical protein
MKRNGLFHIVSTSWSVVVACAFSFLIHSTDSDVGGFSGLLNLSGIVSVVTIAVMLLAPMLGCILMYARRGWRGFITALVSISLVLGAFLTMAGSTAPTIRDLSVSFGGSVALFVLVFAAGTLPQVMTAARRVRSV